MEQKKENPFQEMGCAEVVRRIIFLCISMFVMAFGVAFTIQADLGTSPISSFPYVCSLVFPLTVGEATIIMHCVLIGLQVLILRRKYQIIQLIQLPVALLFGVLTDLTLNIVSGITPVNYGMRWLCCAVGIVLVAVGVSMEVTSKITTLAGEGFILAVCRVSRIKFSNMKVCFDVSLVALACLLSLIGLHSIKGVREGTLAAAIFVGLLTRRVNPLMERLEQRVLCSHPR